MARRAALAPVGIEPTHFTLLHVLLRTPRLSTTELGERLIMDPTTVTRTLRLIELAGLVEKHQGRDRREKRWLLTEAGAAKFAQAAPLWECAKSGIRKHFGEQPATELQRLSFGLASTLTNLATRN
jgi:DNA-binding MarR family transcriptional regulator